MLLSCTVAKHGHYMPENMIYCRLVTSNCLNAPLERHVNISNEDIGGED